MQNDCAPYLVVYPESQSQPPVVYYLPDDLDSVHAGSFQIDRVLCYAAVYPESQSPPPVVDAQAPQSCMKPKWNDRLALAFARTNLLFRQYSVLAVRCWLCHTGHASSQRIPTTSLRSLNIGAPKARQIARTAWIA